MVICQLCIDIKVEDNKVVGIIIHEYIASKTQAEIIKYQQIYGTFVL